MALTAPTANRRPRPGAASRRGFRHYAPLPVEPTRLEVLAAVRLARSRAGRCHEWDARLETSVIAVLAYLWRRGRGEKQAGAHGSARYGCSLAQLVVGLAPIMDWGTPPPVGSDERARWVDQHRKTLQRWLGWLALAGLIFHTPQQDEDAIWWRTIIELHATPQLPCDALTAAVQRARGCRERERRRELRGALRPPGRRLRNLTAILSRARLSRAERRARGIARRRELSVYGARQAVRAAICESLAEAVKTHQTHPFGASTTSRTSSEHSDNESAYRGLTRAVVSPSELVPEPPTSTTGSERTSTREGEELRWAVYREVMRARFARSDDEWAAPLAASTQRLEQLLTWPEDQSCLRWRLIEAWTVAAHGAHMAAAGGFRLAFWREAAEHHGPRLDRALDRYVRCVDVRPRGFPAGAVAAFACFLRDHTPRQEGAERGMAYDVQRFNELTKQMSAYAHVIAGDYLERVGARASRRRRIRELAEQVNERLRFRLSGAALLDSARALLNSDDSDHQAAGRGLYARAQQRERLAQRDQRLLAGEHPGQTDRRYIAACVYAERWQLPTPDGGSPSPRPR